MDELLSGDAELGGKVLAAMELMSVILQIKGRCEWRLKEASRYFKITADGKGFCYCSFRNIEPETLVKFNWFKMQGSWCRKMFRYYVRQNQW